MTSISCCFSILACTVDCKILAPFNHLFYFIKLCPDIDHIMLSWLAVTIHIKKPVHHITMPFRFFDICFFILPCSIENSKRISGCLIVLSSFHYSLFDT